MFFTLDTNKKTAQKTQKLSLASIGWKEEDLQQLLYENMDQVFPENELLLIKQSVKGSEEPDLLAIDRDGNLNIFELKANQSHESNLLQILRYGQIFGQRNYEFLNQKFINFNRSETSLLENINAKFSTQLKEADINSRQKFILLTNGTDYKTRQSINYWASQGINIQSWIYRLHKLGDQILIEFDQLQIKDNPFEDLSSGWGNSMTLEILLSLYH